MRLNSNASQEAFSKQLFYPKQDQHLPPLRLFHVSRHDSIVELITLHNQYMLLCVSAPKNVNYFKLGPGSYIWMYVCMNLHFGGQSYYVSGMTNIW